jgi:hypothetical protein
MSSLTGVAELEELSLFMLEKVQDSFSFQVHAGDARTVSAQVAVLVPVSVLDPVINFTPPAYLKSEPVNNYLASSMPNNVFYRSFNNRWDYQLSEKHRFFFRWMKTRCPRFRAEEVA